MNLTFSREKSFVSSLFGFLSPIRYFLVKLQILQEIVTRAKASHARGSIGAPMPGEILELKVKEGDKVSPKTPLFVLSAMKMEMVIDSPIAGTVKKIHCAPKTRVLAGDLVVEVEP